MIFEANDELFDFIPAIGHPIGSVRFDSDFRQPDRNLFPQSEAEKRQAVNLRTRIGFDAENETLVVRCHLNFPDWADIRHALTDVCDGGKAVRRIILYVHPDVYRENYMLFTFEKYERNESLEKGQGYFALVRNLADGVMEEQAGAA